MIPEETSNISVRQSIDQALFALHYVFLPDSETSILVKLFTLIELLNESILALKTAPSTWPLRATQSAYISGLLNTPISLFYLNASKKASKICDPSDFVESYGMFVTVILAHNHYEGADILNEYYAEVGAKRADAGLLQTCANLRYAFGKYQTYEEAVFALTKNQKESSSQNLYTGASTIYNLLEVALFSKDIPKAHFYMQESELIQRRILSRFESPIMQHVKQINTGMLWIAILEYRFVDAMTSLEALGKLHNRHHAHLSLHHSRKTRSLRSMAPYHND
ncbi:hypothetical protein BC829DRAFT_185114 [Chytridium lagenaria]|nr:hypothetical protein BC829DRAFT_185114 [Chytridium lagenaria]